MTYVIEYSLAAGGSVVSLWLVGVSLPLLKKTKKTVPTVVLTFRYVEAYYPFAAVSMVLTATPVCGIVRSMVFLIAVVVLLLFCRSRRPDIAIEPSGWWLSPYSPASLAQAFLLFLDMPVTGESRLTHEAL
jgi:hypothetical protein